MVLAYPVTPQTEAGAAAVAPPPVQPMVQPLLPRFGPKDLATLRVKGTDFQNWTSVRIESRLTEWFPKFQFEVSEATSVPGPAQFRWGDLVLNAMQFQPGDIVQAFIGGISAVFGYITERHAAYDGSMHAVQLIGVGNTADLVNSVPPPEKWGGHDGKNWEQLTRDLMAHLGINLTTIGNVDGTPFENIQVQPGEPISQTVERYARMRSILVGSNPLGGLVGIGEHAATPSGDLIEGWNILRANCVLRDEAVYHKIFAVGQTIGSDSGYGDSQNKQIATLDGSSSRNRYTATVADIADTAYGVQRRVDMERVFTEGSILQAEITVQGWFKDNNQSEENWRAGEYYNVTSSSLLLDNALLGCAGCVYEQNEGGTTTTLTLVMPLHMHGLVNLGVGNPTYLAGVQAAQILAAQEAEQRRNE